MAHPTREEWVHAVARRAGMTGDAREDPSAAVAAICSRIAAALPTLDRDALARALPFALLPEEERLSAEAARTPAERDGDRALFSGVAEALHLPLGAAVELTEAVLCVLGESVDDDLRVRLEKHLPPPLVAHLRGRPPSAPPSRASARAPEPPPPRRTLSSGRVGSSHPLAEAAPPTGHQHSVANDPAPHADTKLSGARR
jgi:hypothetical protein